MKLYLAGLHAYRGEQKSLYRLDSFAYINKNKPCPQPDYKDYILDSGAFTFMSKNRDGDKVSLDWDKYVDEYAEYVKQNNVRNFLELDIDNIIGYQNVLKLRDRLERLVGRQCIPVWHVSRGVEDFKKMVREYKYVAVGGFAATKKATQHQRYFQIMIDEAHRNNCKIHGLGFTNPSKLQNFNFDSVDSTSWIQGAAFGTLVRFNGMKVEPIKRNTRTQRCVLTSKQMIEWNLREWLKFQKYAEVYL